MDDLPVEFKILNIKPPKWNPSIVAGYARMMAYEMQEVGSQSFYMPPLLPILE